MNGFWDIIGEGEKRGKCETNFFHMYIYREIADKEVYKLDTETKGTFMHEYLHYLQFVSTIFGISYGIIYNNYFGFCREYFSEHDTIEIPVNIRPLYPLIDRQIERYKALKGSEGVSISINKIEINQDDILEAKKNKTGIDVLGVNTETKETEVFVLGYLCIIESMADIFQSFFDATIEHPEIPYKAVQIICNEYLPEFGDDKKMLFSICLCSLMYNNPAYGFFEVLDIVRKNPRMNGMTLYSHMLEESELHHITCRTLKELSLKFISDYQSNIESTIGTDLEYFSKVFENCSLEVNSGESFLLKLLYETDITSDESVQLLVDFYGFPLVEAENLTLMAKLPTEESTYKDIAFLRGLEMVINRVSPKIDRAKYPIYNPQCSMYDKCLKSLYAEENPKFEMTKDCENKQWQKEGICLMTQSLKIYKLYGKNIIQSLLPADMQ